MTFRPAFTPSRGATSKIYSGTALVNHSSVLPRGTQHSIQTRSYASPQKHKSYQYYQQLKNSKDPDDFFKKFNDVDTIKLNQLQYNPGAKHKEKRVGRGIGSGRGKTSTKGHKGQKARSGNNIPLAFEGGQTPLSRRAPKFGHSNAMFKLNFTPISLSTIQYLIDTGRIDPSSGTITMKTLYDCGAIKNVKYPGVKLLSDGAEYFTAKVDIQVPRASKKAIDVVEAAGGNVRCVYYNRLGIRALLHPEKFLVLPKRAMPPPKLWKWYSQEDVRGYLSVVDPLSTQVVTKEEQELLKVRDAAWREQQEALMEQNAEQQ